MWAEILRTVRGFFALLGVDFGIDFGSLELPFWPLFLRFLAPPWRSLAFLAPPPGAPWLICSAPWNTVVAVGWLTAGRR